MGYDELLSSILQASTAQLSLAQNEDVRRISAWVAIIAVPTMIAGIYGMNFTYIPELQWLVRVSRRARRDRDCLPAALSGFQTQRLALARHRPHRRGCHSRSR